MMKGSILAAALLAFGAAACSHLPSGLEETAGWDLKGDIVPVHDPAVIKQGDTYFLFATTQERDGGGLIHIRTSTDLLNWTRNGAVFPVMPSWAKEQVPGTVGIWAPDVSVTNGEYRVYYSISTFGKNRSAIGLATTSRLDPSAPGSGWTDKGPVIQSRPEDDFNAIDPNIFTDAQGRQWMTFGSFWSGIKMIAIDPETGMRAAGDDTIHSLARRPSPGAVEAPFVIRRGGYYYLFVSFDSCCRGANSTYNTVVGRSASPTGPYVDRDGTPMMESGGTMVLPSAQGTGSRYVGRGHVAILEDSGADYIVYHAYDTQQNGAPTLRIQRLTWSADGWPSADSSQ
jgi:arabinan endo-1,5-alpha-L-arabinosidase